MNPSAWSHRNFCSDECKFPCFSSIVTSTQLPYLLPSASFIITLIFKVYGWNFLETETLCKLRYLQITTSSALQYHEAPWNATYLWDISSMYSGVQNKLLNVCFFPVFFVAYIWTRKFAKHWVLYDTKNSGRFVSFLEGFVDVFNLSVSVIHEFGD